MKAAIALCAIALSIVSTFAQDVVEDAVGAGEEGAEVVNPNKISAEVDMRSLGFLSAYGALTCISVLCIWIGSYRSLNAEESDVMEKSDAAWFPVIGSSALFGLYLVFRFLNKEYVNMVLSVYFAVLGALAIMGALAPTLTKILPASLGGGEPPKGKDGKAKYPYALDFGIPFIKSGEEDNKFHLRFGAVHIYAGLVGVAVVLWHVTARHWIANNLMGIAFCITGIEQLSLGSFQVGIILLTGLFFYDVFWVFGTEVMVSVAQNVNQPIKLLWPRELFIEDPKFSMLGLGDIVIPGIFIALLIHFDAKMAKATPAQKAKGAFPVPYFNTVMAGYLAGLILTVLGMIYSRHAQPALLYLVPCCALSVIIKAFQEGRFSELWNFEREGEKKDEKKAGKEGKASEGAPVKVDSKRRRKEE